MSDESPLQTRLTTDVPLASGSQENYVLLLVLLCVFAGGTLMILSVLLVFCHRCCRAERRYSRASDDLEKTNTTYIEESQPTHDVAIRLDSGESLCASSCHGDVDAGHFLSASCTGRRVSFNEAAIYEQSGKDPERGRRYTLTEGDFHHLKRARLTQLQLQPAALNILTILESPESSGAAPQTPALAIFQPSDGLLPEAAGVCSVALPGDSLNSSAEHNKPSRSHTIEVMTDRDSTSCPAQGSVFHFLSKLRRHASLEGAAPLFSVKKWRLEPVQRAASLDTRGSPRRRVFQRQRAASETLDPGEEHWSGAGDFLLRDPSTEPPRRLSAGSLDAEAPSAFSRLEVEAVMELRCGDVERAVSSLEAEEAEERLLWGCVSRQESLEQPSLSRDIWSLRASLEKCASSDLSSNDRDSTRSDADSVCSTSRAGLNSGPSQDIDDDMDDMPFDDAGPNSRPGRMGRDSVDSERSGDGDSNNRKLLQMDSGYASIEAPCKPPDELRLFASASERRRFFTSSGRKRTVCESFEARLFKEELEDEATGGLQDQESVKPRPRFRRRDYSIDEKTEALFNEFLRHDPQFDQQGSPSLRHRHRSRIHLRKQWQRSKQSSDPGAARYSPSLERQRCFPLRRGDSANLPLDTRYHSTLPRIASAADEENETERDQSSDPDPGENANNSSNNSSRQFTPSQTEDKTAEETGTTHPTDSHKHSIIPDQNYTRHTLTDASPSDKLSSTLEDRLYSDLRTRSRSPEHIVTVSRTAPDL